MALITGKAFILLYNLQVMQLPFFFSLFSLFFSQVNQVHVRTQPSAKVYHISHCYMYKGLVKVSTGGTNSSLRDTGGIT